MKGKAGGLQMNWDDTGLQQTHEQMDKKSDISYVCPLQTGMLLPSVNYSRLILPSGTRDPPVKSHQYGFIHVLSVTVYSHV